MNELDELMNRDPVELSSQDIDKIIEFHRKYRARLASGEKPEKQKVDLSAILGKITPKQEPIVIKRRV